MEWYIKNIQQWIFSHGREDLVVYWNIKKSGIYVFVAQLVIFPYNDSMRWVFSHLDEDTTTMINEFGDPIASLKLDNIHARYHLWEPNVYLNKSSLEKFGEDHPNMIEFVEQWWSEDT